MKNNNIKKGVFTALLLASPFVTAGVKYPAADFQPKVVYQDSNYEHKSSGSASASLGEKAQADSNYPAATFKPQVLFQDKDYKHTEGLSTKKSIPLAVWEEAVEEEQRDELDAATEASGEADDSMNILFSLMVLAGAAFLYRKKGKCTHGKKSAPKNADDLTGVAKYLQNKTPKLSGVAKYLEANQPAPKSGVAKYVAKKVVDNKRAAAEKTTGVEKYMRNQKRG